MATDLSEIDRKRAAAEPGEWVECTTEELAAIIARDKMRAIEASNGN